MMTDFTQSPLPEPSRRPRWVVIGTVIAVVAALLFGGHSLLSFGSATFTVVNTFGNESNISPAPGVTPIAQDPEYALPKDDPDRLDILVMGMRGKDDVANGGLLTDTILLFTLDEKTGRGVITSIPRDLTLRVTDDHVGKINEIYAHYGVDGTRKMFSRILGVNIDHVVVVDFTAFKDVVDTLGGVTITLAKPFSETEQWGYPFSLPAGANTLNGDQALYYARSRYGSSDFDRSLRQMQIILAIKQKMDGLNLIGDPLKILQILTTVRSHVATDLGVFDIGTLKQLVNQGGQLEKLQRYQITTDNLVYQTMENGIFELLPTGGTLSHIKDFIGTILNEKPTIWSPSPSPSSS